MFADHLFGRIDHDAEEAETSVDVGSIAQSEAVRLQQCGAWIQGGLAMAHTHSNAGPRSPDYGARSPDSLPISPTPMSPPPPEDNPRPQSVPPMSSNPANRKSMEGVKGSRKSNSRQSDLPNIKGPGGTRSGWGDIGRRDQCSRLIGHQCLLDNDKHVLVTMKENNTLLRERAGWIANEGKVLRAEEEELRKLLQEEAEAQMILKEGIQNLRQRLAAERSETARKHAEFKELRQVLGMKQEEPLELDASSKRVLDRIQALEAEVTCWKAKAESQQKVAVVSQAPSLVELHELLPRIALAAHCRRARDFSADDARKQLQEEAPELLPALERTLATALAGDCLLLLTHDMVEGEARFRFSHPSFQDYFSALHAAQCMKDAAPSPLPALADILFDRHWRKFLSFLFEHPTLTVTLSLESRGLGNAEGRTLAAFLRTGTAIRRLELRENKISTDGARYLAEALSADPSLQYLDLSFNRLGDEAAAFIAAALERNTRLQSLILSFNNISDEGASRLLESLSFNSTLRTIALWKNPISRNILRSIEEELTKGAKGEKEIPSDKAPAPGIVKRASLKRTSLTSTTSME